VNIFLRIFCLLSPIKTVGKILGIPSSQIAYKGVSKMRRNHRRGATRRMRRQKKHLGFLGTIKLFLDRIAAI
jgi:hypothetical protein